MNYLTEANTGNLGFFYHGDKMSPSSFLHAISTGTYNNTASMYGKGLYCVRTPLDALLNGYGPYVYKIYVRNLKNFLHLDRSSFATTYPNEAARMFGKIKSKNMEKHERDEKFRYPGGKGEIPDNTPWRTIKRAYNESPFSVDNYAKYAKFTRKDNDIEFIRWQLEQKGLSEKDRLGSEVLSFLTRKLPSIRKSAWTSELFYHMRIPIQEMGFDGVAYTGQNDRRCLLVYNFTNLVPVAYTVHPKAYEKDNLWSRNGNRESLEARDRDSISDYMQNRDDVELDRVKGFANMVGDSEFEDGIRKSISNYVPNKVGPKAIGFVRKWSSAMMEMMRNTAPSIRDEELIDKLNNSPKLANQIMETMKRVSYPSSEKIAENLNETGWYTEQMEDKLTAFLNSINPDKGGGETDSQFCQCLFYFYKAVYDATHSTLNQRIRAFNKNAIYVNDFSEYLSQLYLLGSFIDYFHSKLKAYRDNLENNAQAFEIVNRDLEDKLHYTEKTYTEGKLKEYNEEGLENVYNELSEMEESLQKDMKFSGDNFIRQYVRSIFLKYCKKETEILETAREILTVTIPKVIPIVGKRLQGLQ